MGLAGLEPTTSGTQNQNHAKLDHNPRQAPSRPQFKRWAGTRRIGVRSWLRVGPRPRPPAQPHPAQIRQLASTCTRGCDARAGRHLSALRARGGWLMEVQPARLRAASHGPPRASGARAGQSPRCADLPAVVSSPPPIKIAAHPAYKFFGLPPSHRGSSGPICRAPTIWPRPHASATRLSAYWKGGCDALVSRSGPDHRPRGNGRESTM